MDVTTQARWAGAAAVVGGLVAVVLTPPFATAFFLAYPGENTLPFWFDGVEDRLGSLITFDSPIPVYETYGRLYNVVYVLFLPLVVVLHRVASGSVLERRGARVLLTGLGMTTAGVAGDYWLNGLGFPLEFLGLLTMMVGATMWGLGSRRGKALPRLWCWLFVACGPGALVTSFLLGHLPSGPTLSFALVWLVVGVSLVLRPVGASAEPSEEPAAA